MTATPPTLSPKRPTLAWTDGSARPTNPGFGGWAYVIDERATSTVFVAFEHMPFGTTNNLAELTAIHACLSCVTAKIANGDDLEPLVILTDSQWAQRVITGQYKAKIHVPLITKIQALINSMADCRIEWVKGHAGKSWNEVVDRLANLATYDKSFGSTDQIPREEFFEKAEEFLLKYEHIRAQA